MSREQGDVGLVLDTGVVTLDPQRVGREPGSDTPGRWRVLWPELLVALTALTVYSLHVGRPSPWRDEGVTHAVASRSLGEILQLTDSVDRVHLAYYLAVHAAYEVHPGLTTARMISVLAMTAAAVLLVRIGRRLAGPGLGVLAGAILVCSPLASRYAQEARSSALVLAMVTAATLALLAAADRPGSSRRWALYVVLVLLGALGNVLALLVLLPHAVFVLASRRAARGRWLAAAGSTLALALPWVALTRSQQQQVAWLPQPDGEALADLFDRMLDPSWLVAALVVAAVVLTARRLPPAMVLGLAWTFTTPVVLWAVSQVHPLYSWRYVMYALAGGALLVAAATHELLVRLPRGGRALRAVLAVAVLAGLTVGGLHMQQVYRRPALGHSEDVRGVGLILQRQAHPGDAVLFVPNDLRIMDMTYPGLFRKVDDVALAEDAASSGTIAGRDVDGAELARRLAPYARVWVVTGPEGLTETRSPADVSKVGLLRAGFTRVDGARARPFLVDLYERSRK